jgi:hypothetical protein
MNKKIRKLVYQKYNGRCAYCGNPIDIKEMQVDHYIPKCRGCNDNEITYLEHRGEDNLDNYMPSCRMCNFYKSRCSIEQFKSKINNMLDYKHTFATRFALKYGILTEHEWDGKFYFEKVDNLNG